MPEFFTAGISDTNIREGLGPSPSRGGRGIRRTETNLALKIVAVYILAVKAAL